jgi:F-type H+-transporting ATPase subunit delta
MSLAVANQYAKALMDVVARPGARLAPEAALAQIDSLAEALAGSPELKGVMLSPAVSREVKRRAIGRVGDLLGLDPLIHRFLDVITVRRRVGLFPLIRAAFRAQIDERNGVLRAQVAAPRELTGEQRTEVAATLSRLTGKEVLCEYAVEPSLIGGLTAKIGSTVYDGSVAGQLEGLRRRLASVAH